MEIKKARKNNGKIKLYPIKFEDAVRNLLKVKPLRRKTNDNKDNC
jgi:hypothetical protein